MNAIIDVLFPVPISDLRLTCYVIGWFVMLYIWIRIGTGWAREGKQAPRVRIRRDSDWGDAA